MWVKTYLSRVCITTSLHSSELSTLWQTRKFQGENVGHRTTNSEAWYSKITISMLNFQNVVTALWLWKELPWLLGNMPPWHEQRDKRGRMSAYNSLKILKKKKGGGGAGGRVEVRQRQKDSGREGGTSERKWEDGGIKAKTRAPLWLSGRESACLCRRHGSRPWSAEHLSQCVTTIEPVL